MTTAAADATTTAGRTVLFLTVEGDRVDASVVGALRHVSEACPDVQVLGSFHEHLGLAPVVAKDTIRLIPAAGPPAPSPSGAPSARWTSLGAELVLRIFRFAMR